MNWLKKGPQLKLPKPSLKGSRPKGPEIRPPAFLADFYYDLRDRRLLLPIALVAVAIVAVPFLMGSDPEPLAPLPPTGAAELGGVTAKASRLTVVEATPGLRDYRKRLEDRSPSDPFLQQYTESGSAGGGEGSGTAEGSSSSSSSFSESVTIEDSSTTVEVDPEGSGGGGGGSPGGSGSGGSGDGGGVPSGDGVRLIEFVFDVQISHAEETAAGGQKMSEPEVRRRVPGLTQLPGKKTAVITMAGVNLHNGRAFILVSDDVKSLDGDFVCKTRTADGICELLEIETGFPLELLYGPDEVRYRFKVIKIDAVWAGKPGDGSSSSRAAFGGPAAKVLPRP